MRKKKTDVKAEGLVKWVRENRIPLMYVDEIFRKAKSILKKDDITSRRLCEESEDRKRYVPRKSDIDVLLKYKDGAPVPEEDYKLLTDYSTIGIVHMGFSFKKEEVQARLTKSGKRILGLSNEEAT